MSVNHWYEVRQRCIDETRRQAADLSQPTGVLHYWPSVYCQCGREFHMHKIDTKRCGTDDGQCIGFVPSHVIWTERLRHRIDLVGTED